MELINYLDSTMDKRFFEGGISSLTCLVYLSLSLSQELRRYCDWREKWGYQKSLHMKYNGDFWFISVLLSNVDN